MVNMGGYAAVLGMGMIGCVVVACFVSAITARRYKNGTAGVLTATLAGSITGVGLFYAIAAALGR